MRYCLSKRQRILPDSSEVRRERVMSVGLRADRPGRAIQSAGQARVFAAVDTVRSCIRGTVRAFRRPRHAGVYYAHNGRRDQPLFVRSCSAGALRRVATVTHLSSTPLRQVFQRLGPVCLQQPGERAVGKQLPACLAGRAIVRLVLRVDDPLDRRVAHRAGMTILPVHGHAVTKGGHSLREALAGLRAQPLNPF